MVVVQDLSVLVTSDLKEEQIELMEDEHDISVVDTHAFSDDQVGTSPNPTTSSRKPLTMRFLSICS